jgi:hypothetical protein
VSSQIQVSELLFIGVVPFLFDELKSFFGFDSRTLLNFADKLLGQLLCLLLSEKSFLTSRAIVKSGNATVFKQDPEISDNGVIYDGNI